jgi:hypothetical protein
MNAPTLDSVRVRMYCQGFGDCFLLTFSYRAGGQTIKKKHMLIDYGVWRDDKNCMDDIAQNIMAETGGQLDLLVITHQHKDHLSGFYRKRRESILKDLTIKRLWLAWTEDIENNQLARDLAQQYGRAVESLQMANDQLQRMNGQATALGLTELSKLTRHLLELEEGSEDESAESTQALVSPQQVPSAPGVNGHGRAADTQSAPAPKSRSLNKTALDWLKQKAEKVEYLKPNQRISGFPVEDAHAGNDPGLQFYVLGPPEDHAFLRQNESQREGELYLNANMVGDMYSFASAFSDFGTDYQSWISNSPFDDDYFCPVLFEQENIDTPEAVLDGLSISARDRAATSKRLSHLKTCAVYQTYFLGDKANDIGPAGSQKRRIDHEWLRASQSLALNMNSHTNNTSLVLAIELDQTKQVLLFPGDAQYGNWQSWFAKKYEWKIEKTATESRRIVTVEDLLGRTILYKVSHHGSHNATPKRQGLDLMSRDDLIALIPVSKQTATDNDWPIPYEKLIDEFNRRSITYVSSDDPKNPHLLQQHNDLFTVAGDGKSGTSDKDVPAELYVECTFSLLGGTSVV